MTMDKDKLAKLAEVVVVTHAARERYREVKGNRTAKLSSALLRLPGWTLAGVVQITNDLEALGVEVDKRLAEWDAEQAKQAEEAAQVAEQARLAAEQDAKEAEEAGKALEGITGMPLPSDGADTPGGDLPVLTEDILQAAPVVHKLGEPGSYLPTEKEIEDFRQLILNAPSDPNFVVPNMGHGIPVSPEEAVSMLEGRAVAEHVADQAGTQVDGADGQDAGGGKCPSE